jgi:hypothetical protein
MTGIQPSNTPDLRQQEAGRWLKVPEPDGGMDLCFPSSVTATTLRTPNCQPSANFAVRADGLQFWPEPSPLYELAPALRHSANLVRTAVAFESSMVS